MAKNAEPAQTLKALSQEISDLSQEAGRQVVSLDTRGSYPTTGTVWEPDYVVTAEHALRRDEDIHVTLDDGSEHAATLAGSDPTTDLALVRVEGLAGGFRERAGVLRPGSFALALSRNSEKSLNASLAVINAVGGEWTTRRGGRIDNYLRLDVAIYAGFSGGPLIDPAGALIGINSSSLSRHSAVAIPASTVTRVVEELKERGYIRHGYLGIASFPIALGEALRRELGLGERGGLIIVGTEEGSSAQKAGIIQGDILLDLDATAVQDPEELQNLLGADRVGKRIGARLLRGGELLEVEIEVGERPQRRGSWHHRGPRRGDRPRR